MRSAESWYNEYRGRRNDGALRAEQHLQFIREVQQDALRDVTADIEQRLLMALGAASIPAPVLLALRRATLPQAEDARETVTRRLLGRQS